MKKGEDDKKTKNGEVGSGRVIPLRQVRFNFVFNVSFMTSDLFV